MTTETKPSEPAMRAASWITNTILRCIGPKDDDWTCQRDDIAKIIDRETQLPQILAALEEMNKLAWSDGEPSDLMKLRIIARKTDSLLAAHKTPIE